MAIEVGQRLPEATLTRLGSGGPEQIALSHVLAGRRLLILGMPGAFSPDCQQFHMPSIIRNAEALKAKGIDEILCITVNDPFVQRVWGEQTGAIDAGIGLLADAACEFTEAIGMRFDAPAAGLIARSRRYAMVATDGDVEILQIEEAHHGCAMSGGEALLDLL